MQLILLINYMVKNMKKLENKSTILLNDIDLEIDKLENIVNTLEDEVNKLKIVIKRKDDFFNELNNYIIKN